MSEENVGVARSAYAALNEAYRSGEFAGSLDAFSHPDIVLRTSGMFPETGEYRGREGVRSFTTNQAEAFEEMWIEPLEFIEAGERVVVPVRFGGKTRHTGIPAEFSVVHVLTIHEGKVRGIEMFRTKPEALEAAGLSE